MPVPPVSRAAYLSQHGQSSQTLARILNGYCDTFRLDGRVMREEDAASFTGTVYSYLFTVAFRKLRGTFSEADAEEHAADIACRVSCQALSEKHFTKWVLTDRRAQASTFLFRCAQNAVKDVFRRTRVQRAIVHLSLDDNRAVRRGSEDGLEGQALEVPDRRTLSVETELMLKSEFTELERGMVDGSLTLQDIVDLEGGSRPTACRRRQRCRAKAAKVMGR